MNNFADLCIDSSITPAKNAFGGFYSSIPHEDEFADIKNLAVQRKEPSGDFDILLDFLESAPQKLELNRGKLSSVIEDTEFDSIKSPID